MPEWRVKESNALTEYIPHAQDEQLCYEWRDKNLKHCFKALS